MWSNMIWHREKRTENLLDLSERHLVNALERMAGGSARGNAAVLSARSQARDFHRREKSSECQVSLFYSEGIVQFFERVANREIPGREVRGCAEMVHSAWEEAFACRSRIDPEWRSIAFQTLTESCRYQLEEPPKEEDLSMEQLESEVKALAQENRFDDPIRQVGMSMAGFHTLTEDGMKRLAVDLIDPKHLSEGPVVRTCAEWVGRLGIHIENLLSTWCERRGEIIPFPGATR